jgi:hypothetical protein
VERWAGKLILRRRGGTEDRDLDLLFRNVYVPPLPPRIPLMRNIQLVEMMGGTIQLESVLGEGTTMTVMIPLNKAVVTDVPMIVDDPSPSPSMVEQQWTECWPKREDVRILLSEGEYRQFRRCWERS